MPLSQNLFLICYYLLFIILAKPLPRRPRATGGAGDMDPTQASDKNQAKTISTFPDTSML